MGRHAKLDAAEIWRNVDSLRRDGETDEEFGVRLGFHRSTVAHWRDGKRGFSLDSLAQIAERTNTSLDWLAIGRTRDYAPFHLVVQMASRVSNVLEEALEEAEAIAPTALPMELIKRNGSSAPGGE